MRGLEDTAGQASQQWQGGRSTAWCGEKRRVSGRQQEQPRPRDRPPSNCTRRDFRTGGAACFWSRPAPAGLGHPIPGSRYTCWLGVLETSEPWVALMEKAALSGDCSRASSLLSPL